MVSSCALERLSLIWYGLGNHVSAHGEAPLRVWYLRWRYESAYSPLRVYYRLRNFVALWKLNFIDFRWKVRNTWYWLGIVYAHTFYSKQQNSKYFLFAIKGVWHGLRNRMGPYKED